MQARRDADARITRSSAQAQPHPDLDSPLHASHRLERLLQVAARQSGESGGVDMVGRSLACAHLLHPVLHAQSADRARPPDPSNERRPPQHRGTHGHLQRGSPAVIDEAGRLLVGIVTYDDLIEAMLPGAPALRPLLGYADRVTRGDAAVRRAPNRRGGHVDEQIVRFYDQFATDYHLIVADWDQTVRQQGVVLDRLITYLSIVVIGFGLHVFTTRHAVAMPQDMP